MSQEATYGRRTGPGTADPGLALSPRPMMPLVRAGCRRFTWTREAGDRRLELLRMVRFGLIVGGSIAAAFIWQAVVLGVPNGGDGWSYWQAPYAHPYDRAARDELLSYLYSPAFLQALAPLKLLTFD